MHLLTLWPQLFCSWWQTERPNEYNGWPLQGLPGAHARVCIARGTGAAWMKFKVGWKISWGSSQQNPCVKHTATLKTGYVEARAQEFYLAYELRVLWAHALHSRKQPLENLDPTPQWPWMSPFYCIPVMTYPPWRGPSSVQATVSSSAASLIPGAQHHCNGRRTEHAPSWLRALTGRCSGPFVGDMGWRKGSGRVCGGVSGALPFLSLRHTPLLSALYIGS